MKFEPRVQEELINKYSGKCYVCGRHVEEEKGVLDPVGYGEMGHNEIRHSRCLSKYPDRS